MRRARNQSTGTQSGSQTTQGSTGEVSGTGRNVSGTGSNAGATSTGLRDEPVTRTDTTTSTTYARGAGAQEPIYREDEREATIEHTGLGGGMSMLAGLFAFLFGLAMVVRPLFYHVSSAYAYEYGTNGHAWGWTLIGLGIVLFAAGACYTLGLPFARAAAVALAVLTAVGAFLALAYSPIWGFLVVALSVVALWALLRRNRFSGSRSRMM
jgi:hypothetical protein